MTQLETPAITPTPVRTVRRRTGPRRSPTGLIVGVVVIAAVFAVWWILTTGTGIVEPLYFPTPDSVWQAVTTLRGRLVEDSLATLLRVVLSWFGGSAVGVLVGLLMSRARPVRWVLNPLIEALRPVPPVALIPFVILWFGIGDSGKYFLGALSCFMVMVVNTTVAVGNVPPVYLRAARSLGASNGRVYRTVVLPAILPEILSGFRIGSALSFAVIVAAEFQGAEAGIGVLIMTASRTLNTPVVLLGTIVIAVLAVLLDLVISRVSRYLTRWSSNAA